VAEPGVAVAADAPISTEDAIVAACVVVGENDALHGVDGWSSVDTWRNGPPVRWVATEARLLLQVPAEVSHVGIELWVPGRWLGPAPTAQLTLRDQYAPLDADSQPPLDVSFRLQPGRWQVLECPLRPFGLGDSQRVVCTLRLQWRRAAHGWTWRRERAAVRRVWLRGARVQARDVTIVVLNWNRRDDTLRCLDSLAGAALDGARVLVVDNGSHDGSIAAIHARDPQQAILALPENRGYAGGNNAGIRSAVADGARAVLLLNNDAQVAPDFLPPLLWVMNSHARVAAVSSSTLREGHETLELAYLRVHFGHGLVRRIGVNALPSEGFIDPREVEVAIGCSLLIAVDALRAIGPFDDDYFAYHEEVDWCFRARREGWQVHYQPFSRVFHAGSKSTAALVKPLVARRGRGKPALPNATPLSWNPVRTYLGARNAVRFIRRHARWWQTVYFVAATLYHVPLELLAVVMNHEEELLLGLWNYRIALGWILFGPPETRTAATYIIGLAAAPWRLLVGLPRDLLAAHRAGSTAQIVEHCRGLWDGLRGYPPHLQRLGLQ